MALGVRKRRDGSISVGRWDHELSRVDEGNYPQTHRFATSWVNRALAEGWASISKGQIVVHGDEDVAYQIRRAPGAYCVTCGAQLGEGPARNPEVAAERLAHVAEHSEPVEDPANPAGYEVTDFYEGELNG